MTSDTHIIDGLVRGASEIRAAIEQSTAAATSVATTNVDNLEKLISDSLKWASRVRLNDNISKFQRFATFVDDCRESAATLVTGLGDPMWDRDYDDLATEVIDLLDSVVLMKSHVASLQGHSAAGSDIKLVGEQISELRQKYSLYAAATSQTLERLKGAR